MRDGEDFRVADMSLAARGREEIELAEGEMPGLLALRDEYASSRPLAGARIAGCLHLTVQTAVLIRSLRALGAEVRWASCNIYSTQDHAAAAVVDEGVAAFAYKGETIAEYWDYVDRILRWRDGGGANLILDDGGDASLLRPRGRGGGGGLLAPQGPRGDGVLGGGERGRARDGENDSAAHRRVARMVRVAPIGNSRRGPRRPPPACSVWRESPPKTDCPSPRSTSTTR